MIYRITFGFTGMGQGWSENHAMLNAANNPRDLIPTVEDIANKRAQMLGREFTINAIRISRYATDGGVRSRGVYLKKVNIKNSTTSQSAAAEPAVVALLVRGSAEPSVLQPQFDANQNTTFLGGPLDVCVDNAGVVDPGKGGLQAAFLSWRSAMLNTTIGWLASQTIVDAPIQTIVQNADGTVKFTFAANTLAALTVGTKYRARVRQVNNGNSPLNGELIIIPASGVEANTFEVIGLALAQVGGSIRVYKQTQPFVDYGDLELSLITGKHQRGRPFGSSPGRARKRIRG